MDDSGDSQPPPPLRNATGDILCVEYCWCNFGKILYKAENRLKKHYTVHRNCNLECGKCPNDDLDNRLIRFEIHAHDNRCESVRILKLSCRDPSESDGCRGHQTEVGPMGIGPTLVPDTPAAISSGLADLHPHGPHQ